jgi:HEPN domain-containing protein
LTNHELMLAWLEEAATRLIEASTCLEKGWHHRVVRLSQESSELAFKALLAFCGVDVPKTHHLAKLVSQQSLVRQLPPDVQSRLYQSGRALAQDRIPSFYGGAGSEPPATLYGPQRAQEALTQAQFILDTVRGLIKACGDKTK